MKRTERLALGGGCRRLLELQPDEKVEEMGG